MNRITRREFTKRALTLPIAASLGSYFCDWTARAETGQQSDQQQQLAFGWKPEALDYKPARKFTAPVSVQQKPLPPIVDLRKKHWPDPYRQGGLGSCVSNSAAFAIWFARNAAKETPPFTPSRLFIYYFGRQVENTLNEDGGLVPSTAFKVPRQLGVCPETEWPYDENGGDYHGHFTPGSRATQQPDAKALADAKPHTDIYDYSVNSVNAMQQCLASGFPFVFGFYMYSSFYKPGTYDPVEKTGIPSIHIPYPKDTDVRTGAGHCVVAVGYDSTKKEFLCRNSWGTTGPYSQEHGYFYMPFDYLANRQIPIRVPAYKGYLRFRNYTTAAIAAHS